MPFGNDTFCTFNNPAEYRRPGLFYQIVGVILAVTIFLKDRIESFLYTNK